MKTSSSAGCGLGPRRSGPEWGRALLWMDARDVPGAAYTFPKPLTGPRFPVDVAGPGSAWRQAAQHRAK